MAARKAGKGLIGGITSLIAACTAMLEKPGSQVPHALMLALRLWIAIIFWKSGLTKIESWDTTLFLFEDEYAVPLLPSPVAAWLATAAELVMPILLVVGLGTRFAAFTLLMMTAVIQFTYEPHHQHVLWALSLLAILTYGAGAYSCDTLLRKSGSTSGGAAKSPMSGVTLAIATVTVVLLAFFCAHEVIAAIADTIDPWLPPMLESWKAFGGK